MKSMPLQTPESLSQLDADFWRAVRELAKVRTSYFKKGDTEKVKPQEEVLNLFHYLEGLMEQMTVKIVNRSRTIATAIANEALSNPKKGNENMSKLRMLDQIFKDLQDNAGNKKQMSHGIGNLAAGMRKQIYPIITNTQTQLAQIVKREQQAKKIPKAPLRRRLAHRLGFGRA